MNKILLSILFIICLQFTNSLVSVQVPCNTEDHRVILVNNGNALSLKPDCGVLWFTYELEIKYLSSPKNYSVYVLEGGEYQKFKNSKTIDENNRNSTEKVRVLGEFLEYNFNKTTWFNDILPDDPYFVIKNNRKTDSYIYYNIKVSAGSFLFLIIFGVIAATIIIIVVVIILLILGAIFLVPLCKYIMILYCCHPLKGH